MEALSLQTRRFSPKETRSVRGIEIPWEVDGYEEDFLRSHDGGFFDLTPWQTVEVSGPDARDYLNRLSTRDFRAPALDRLWAVGFLTGKAQVIALGWVEAWDPERFLLSFAPPQGDTALAHLQQMHFSENLAIRDVSDQWTWFALWDPKGIGTALETQALAEGARGWQDPLDPCLTWVRVQTQRAKEVMEGWSLPLLGHRLFEYFRLRSGAADIDRGIAPGALVLEADLGDLISRAKGCYPGQEVVERVFTYGQVNQQLRRVRVESSLPPSAVPQPLVGDGKAAGQLVLWRNDPGRTDQGLGLALVKRPFWDCRDNLSQVPGLKVALVF